MGIYENCLICIVINISKTIENQEKTRKIRNNYCHCRMYLQTYSTSDSTEYSQSVVWIQNKKMYTPRPVKMYSQVFLYKREIKGDVVSIDMLYCLASILFQGSEARPFI